MRFGGGHECVSCWFGETKSRPYDVDDAAVTPPGGDLLIEWRDDDRIIMTGPAEWEFSGHLDPDTGAWSRDEDAPSQEAI